MEFKELTWISIILLSIAAVIIHEIGLTPVHLLSISLAILAVNFATRLIAERSFSIEQAVTLLMFSVGMLTYLFNLHVEGSLVLGLFALAEILEDYAELRAERSLRSLMEYMPRRAKLISGSSVVEVDVKDVGVGDLILVGRGDRIPVDGVVVEGIGEVDQSVITGEPLPIVVRQHETVYAGSLVVNGAFKLRALASGDSTLLSRLVALVEEYKERKARIERLVHRFSKAYLPLMLLLALLAWAMLDVRATLVIIAVACPSAFLVSISSTLLYSLALLARRGVLSKGTAPIELASKARILAFDKTGTLTLSRPRVERIIACKDGTSPTEILKLAASIEVASNHPLAGAVVERARTENLRLLAFESISELPGMGVVGTVNGFEVAVGSMELMVKIGVRVLDRELSSPHVYVACNGELLGIITFSEDVDPRSQLIVKELREMGFRIAMLTGDRKENARKVAQTLGISDFYAELSPEDKVLLIEDLRRRHEGIIVMVGDGINDAPALAAADLGIAVGSIQAAIEAGDVALTHKNLECIPYFFKFSRKVFRKIFENLVAILAVKTCVILLSIYGLVPLWVAVALGDDGALLLAFINILMLRQG